MAISQGVEGIDSGDSIAIVRVCKGKLQLPAAISQGVEGIDSGDSIAIARVVLRASCSYQWQ